MTDSLTRAAAKPIDRHRIALNTVVVGFDGAHSYAERLAADLPKMYPDTDFIVYCREDQFVAQRSADVAPNLEFHAVSIGSRLGRTLWEQFVLPLSLRRARATVLYTFSTVDVFLSPCPTVIRIGNTAPFEAQVVAEESYRGKLRLLYLRWFGQLSSMTADCTLVMSEAAAALLRARGLRGHVVGINRGVEVPAGTAGVGIRQPYLLHVGHLNRYKKILELLDAYDIASERRPDLPPLILAGGDRDADYAARVRTRIAELGLGSRVTLVGSVARDELPELVRGATVIIFSSLAETCPVTLLEHMLLGSALVVARRSVMPDFCGQAVRYFDPDVPESLSAQLCEVLESEGEIERLREASRVRAQALDIAWKPALARRFELLVNVAEGRGVA